MASVAPRLVLPLLLLLASTAAFADADSSDQLDEVLVTARKREENLQRVPLSIGVYNQDELEAQAVHSLADLGQVAPNFLYGQQVQSGSSAGQLYIRGVGQHDTQTAFNPSVGLYVDGVYVARAAANDLDLADVERVEVLYGPQGTLYGKNTNGGAINITTARPALGAQQPTGRIELEAGDYDRLDALTTLSLPLQQNVAALNLSVDHRGQAGYSRRIEGQTQANQNRTAGRAQLFWHPSDALEAVLSIDGTSFDEHSAAYKLVEVRTASTIPTVYAAYTPYRYDNRWVTSSDYTSNGTGPNRNSGNVEGTSLTLTWHSPWATIKSISAYRRLDVESDFDPDGSPLAVLDVFNTVTQHQVSQELQAANGPSNQRIRWILGLYYFKESAQDDQPANVGLEFFHGAANFNPRLHVVNRNYAAYGQLSVDLSDQLRMTLGGRVGNDLADVGRIQVDYPVPAIEQPYVRKSANWTSFLPRASLEYQWTPRIMTYLSAAEGTRSGGFNGRAGTIAEFNRFEPEKVWTFELGLRSDWLGRRLRLNATAFYSTYTDYQILLNSSVTDPATGQPVPFSFVGNMPRARITGGELSLTAVPLTGLTLSTGLGLTDGRYLEVLPGAPVTKQSRFIDTPKTTLTTSAEYSFTVAEHSVVTHLDYTYKSTIEYDYANSPLVAQNPYGLLNGRLTWQSPGRRLSLAVFATNLLNTHYAIGGIDDGPGGALGEVIKLMGAPREWGVAGQYRF